MPGNIRHWIGEHPRWTLVLITLVALVPFLNKPFNIDDPLFIWAARQIHAHPANPYGFEINWEGRQAPMWKITDNPPFASYYIAAASTVLGWGELALHFAFLLPAAAVTMGTFRLARYFCQSPMLAALAGLFTPAFLVSSTTVMSDVLMLALWVWAVVFWVEGADQNNFYKLLAAGCLAGLAEITKYFAVCLIPLLAAYSILLRLPLRKWAPFLLIPLASFWAYQFAMQHLYGLYPLFRTADFSFARQDDAHVPGLPFLIGLAFTGGCLAPALFLMPLLWKKWSAAFLVVGILIASLMLLDPGLLNQYRYLQPAARAGVELQLALWAATGLSIVVLAFSELTVARDAKSVVLVLWMIGTFVFAVFLNWTVNGRSILPMAPALGMLIARRLERNSTGPFPIGKIAVCMAASAALAFYAAEADCLGAMAVRQNVRSIFAAYGQRFKQIHFQGHWGFQFYMSQSGAVPLDLKNDLLKSGDLIAIPANNTNVLLPGPGKAVLVEIYTEPGLPFLTTLNQSAGANFYASILGPLPFVFCQASPEVVAIYSLR